MNIYILKDRENENFYINPKRWTRIMSSAKIIKDPSEARQIRASLKTKKAGSKIDIIEFQLIEIRKI